eukprot:2931145-Amphidinium_carterae.1
MSDLPVVHDLPELVMYDVQCFDVGLAKFKICCKNRGVDASDLPHLWRMINRLWHMIYSFFWVYTDALPKPLLLLRGNGGRPHSTDTEAVTYDRPALRQLCVKR